MISTFQFQTTDRGNGMWQLFVSYMYTFSLTFRPRAASNDSHVPVPGEIAFNDQLEAKAHDPTTIRYKVANRLVRCRDLAVATHEVTLTVVATSGILTGGGTCLYFLLVQL